jgi:branched-chain amino acid transport system substrate-binding protein
MRKIIGTLVILAVLVVIGVFYFNDNNSNVGADKEIIIGAPLSLSGSAANDGENIKKGADLAVEDLAQKGIKVRIIYENDETNPTMTVTSIQKLFATEKTIDALIGPTWGFLVDAGAKLISEHKTVTYSPANTSEIVSARSPYLFFGSLKNAEKDVPTENWLRSQGSKKVAIIVDNTYWGDSHLTAFKTAITKSGAELVMTERLPLGGEKDGMTSAFTKALTAKADTILWTGYENAAAAILIQKIQQQGKNIKFLSASAIPVGLAKNKTISIRSTDSIYYLRPQLSNEFSEKFKTRYGSYPGSYADSAYDGVMLIADAALKKSPTQSIAEYLHSGVTFKGYQTDYSFDENGDIRGGEWIVEKIQN